MSRKMKPKCKECGCICSHCGDQTNLHLHVEIENLKQRLLEREHHIVTMETNFLNDAEKFPNGEFAALTEELLTWQDKYSRLYEAHKRLQKVNQNLEDKLLKIVDKCETEKNLLTYDVASLTQRIVEEHSKISYLTEENERYRNDVNLAIQLLQCKPSNFVSQKFDSLPVDLQQKVRNYMNSKNRSENNKPPEMKTIKVPIPTYPPTAMVYSVNKDVEEKNENSDLKMPNCKSPVDIVSAAIMAKVLEERERERLNVKHCNTCKCNQPEPVQPLCSKCKSIITPSVEFSNTNQASQGLVRYVDVVSRNNKSHHLSSQENNLLLANFVNQTSLSTEALSQVSNDFDEPRNQMVLESPSRILENKNLKLRQKTQFQIENEISKTRLKTADEDSNLHVERLDLGKKIDLYSKKMVAKCKENKTEGRTFLNNDQSTQKKSSSITGPQSQNFVSSIPFSKNKEQGPRVCSLRVQAGSNNILLDNASSFSPILYTNRSGENEISSAVLVHTPRSRSTSNSSNESGKQSKFSSTETQI